VATAAIALVLTTSTAYAINEWSGANIKNGTLTGADIKSNSVPGQDIKDGTVKSADIQNGTLKTADIQDNTVTSLDILDGTLTGADILDETLTEADLANSSVGFAEIQTDAVQASEIADNSIDSGEIVDFSLTNQDIGVLWAEVNGDGTLANQCSGCGVTSGRVGATGSYEVDFARNIATTCTATAVIGPAGGGSAIGQINIADRAGNAEAIFVDTNDSAGAAADRPFRLVVVC
jgi:hypothetical protein